MRYSPYVCMLFYEKESSSVNMLFVATSKFNFMMFKNFFAVPPKITALRPGINKIQKNVK